MSTSKAPGSDGSSRSSQTVRVPQEPGPNPSFPNVVPSHHGHERPERQRPRRDRRTRKSFFPSSPSSPLHSPWIPLLLLTLLFFCAPVSSARVHGARNRRPPAPVLARLARTPGLLFDHSDPPALFARMTLGDGEEEEEIEITPTKAKDKRTAASAAATASSAVSTTTSIPVPFDTNLGANITTSCNNFFHGLLSNKTVTSCHPFSLLLQNSASFFQASRSFVRITQILDATCTVSFDTCRSAMAFYAQQIVRERNCGADYDNGNPTVVQAYNGLIAYQPLYLAACQKDSSGSYCYANAITNASAVADVYPYYLPLGVALPGGYRQTCNDCLRETMAIYQPFAANRSQPLSETYASAAEQMDIACGPGFVNTTVAVQASRGVNLPQHQMGWLSSLVLLVTVLVCWR